MSKNALLGIAVVATIIIAWLALENMNMKRTIFNLKKEIDENEDLNEEIKKRLKELIDNNKEIDPMVASELRRIAELIEIKQDETAVFKLTKIIEKLLKDLYRKDDGVKEIAKKNNRKSPSFADYLEHARNKGVITGEDFHLLSAMKAIRNEEAHELDVKKEKSRMAAAFISGMAIILALCRILKRESIETKKQVDIEEKNHSFENVTSKVTEPVISALRSEVFANKGLEDKFLEYALKNKKE